MIVCDACSSNDRVESFKVIIQDPNHKHDFDSTIDLCSKCSDHATINSLIIGIKEIFKHTKD